MRLQIKAPHDKMIGELATTMGMSPTQLAVSLFQQLHEELNSNTHYEVKEKQNNGKARENNTI